MPRIARVALLVAALIVSPAAAGCGSDDNQYVQDVNAAQAKFASTLTRLQRDIRPSSSSAQDSRTLDGFQLAIRQVVAQLRAITPPDSVRDLHDQLIGEITDYGTTISAAKTKISKGSPQDILAAQADLSTAVARTAVKINLTIDQINKKLHE